MKRIISLIVCLIFGVALLVGCASTPKTTETGVAKLEINKDAKEVKIPAQVNGKYFTEATRHGVVFKDGSNGEKSILRGLTSEKEFYEALNSLGIKAGNNLVAGDKGKGKSIDGAKLNVFVTWEGLGKEIPFSDIFISSDPRPLDIRFGGNIDRANQNNTGCILCLDSCPTGITSNASFAWGESDTVKFNGNKDILPADGTNVTVIFRVTE